jgi:hypothetical protein
MARVRIESGAIGQGTRIWVDDVEVQECREARIRFGLAEANVLELEILATEGVELECEAQVQPTFVPLPGFAVTRVELGGRTYWRTEPDPRLTDEQFESAVQSLRALVVRRG